MKKYAITGGISLALSLLIAWGRGMKPDAPWAESMAALSDGTFSVGILLVCMGALIRISMTGTFDGLTYGIHGIWNRLTMVFRRKDMPTYYEFKQLRAARRGGGWKVPLVVGGALLILSVAAMLAWQAA